MSAHHRLVHSATPSSHAYCLSLLRRYDHENYLAHLLHPRSPAQAVHLASRALNVELVNIRSTVSNEDLARLRVAFFRQSLDSTVNGFPPSTPVFDMLGEAVDTGSLEPLYDLIDARGDEFSYPMVETIQDLERQAKKTHGSLLAVHAGSVGADQKLASEIGAVVGLAVVLRGVPALAGNRLSYMPKGVVRDVGVEFSEVFAGREGGREVFRVVGQYAEGRLAELRTDIRECDRGVRYVYWPLLMAGQYLNMLKRVGYDPFDDGLQRRLRGTYSLGLQMRLLWARLSGR